MSTSLLNPNTSTGTLHNGLTTRIRVHSHLAKANAKAKKDQRSSERDQRKHFKHQRNSSLSFLAYARCERTLTGPIVGCLKYKSLFAPNDVNVDVNIDGCVEHCVSGNAEIKLHILWQSVYRMSKNHSSHFDLESWIVDNIDTKKASRSMEKEVINYFCCKSGRDLRA